jgi:hypothetical protein
MYQGTSLWLWVVQGIIWCCVVAFVIAIGLALLAVAAVVGLGYLGVAGLARAEGPSPPARARRAPCRSFGAPH